MEANVRLDRHGATPLYRQLYEQLAALMRSGALPAGSRLPPERRLATSLGVNRSTVVNAYRELQAAGLVEGRVGSGTVVLAAADDRERPSVLPWWQLMASAPATTGGPLLDEVAAICAREGVISFARGAPAPELFPLAQFQRALDGVLARHGAAVLEDAPPEGHRGLREAIAERMGAMGVRATAEDVLIIGGSHEGLYLLSRVLLEPGDLVVVEAPTYHGALRVFRAAGARVLAVPVDENGMQVDLLESVLLRQRPKFIYTLPTFHNPTGTTLSLTRRRRLLALAARYQVAVVEDDPYSALRYEGEDLPSLKQMDESFSVAYLGTFSKILAPGLRLGWLVAPPPLLRRAASLKRMVDLHTASLPQWAVAELCRSGALVPHIVHLRAQYRRRRDLMAAALARHWPRDGRWRPPSGGFYVWAELPPGLRARNLLGIASRLGLAFLPGEAFYADGQGEGALRLNFSYPPADSIEEGVDRLGRAVARLRGERVAGKVAVESPASVRIIV